MQGKIHRPTRGDNVDCGLRLHANQVYCTPQYNSKPAQYLSIRERD